jgi:two-component system response regulator HydG
MSPRVLIVDDETNMRTTLADILGDEGFEVTTAPSGERAIKLCARRHYDIVLLDVRMRGMDGVEALRRIRRHDKDARIFMMSAYTVDTVERIAIDAGAECLLRKPLDIERLLGLIGENVRTEDA